MCALALDHRYSSALFTIPAFLSRMGLKVLELEPRRVSLLIPIAGGEKHIRIMYAGALFAIAEVHGGAIFVTTFGASKYVPIIKHMEIGFMRPTTTDVTVTIELPREEVDRINLEL